MQTNSTFCLVGQKIYKTRSAGTLQYVAHLWSHLHKPPNGFFIKCATIKPNLVIKIAEADKC